MDWLSIVATGLVAGIVLFLLIAIAVGFGIRRFVREDIAVGRPQAAMGQLVEAMTMLQRQSTETRAQVQALTQSHQRMADEIGAMRDRIGDGGTTQAPSGPSRLLH